MFCVYSGFVWFYGEFFDIWGIGSCWLEIYIEGFFGVFCGKREDGCKYMVREIMSWCL